MNIAVLYYSKTGNTKMLAEIACSEIKNNGHSVDLFNMNKNELPDCIQYDLVLLGSYCDSNSYPQIVRKILENLKCKKLGVFVTHATYEDGVYYEKWAKGCEAFYDNICKVRHIEKAGYFHCRSKPSGPIALFCKNGCHQRQRRLEEV
jgi:flavodoxin